MWANQCGALYKCHPRIETYRSSQNNLQSGANVSLVKFRVLIFLASKTFAAIRVHSRLLDNFTPAESVTHFVGAVVDCDVIPKSYSANPFPTLCMRAYSASPNSPVGTIE